MYPPSLLEDKLPEWAYNVMRLNPMFGFAEAFRATLYDGTAPGARTLLGLAAVSFVTLVAGWKIFGRLSSRFAEEI